MGDVIVATFNSIGYAPGPLDQYLSFNTITSAGPIPDATLSNRSISFPFPVIVRYLVVNVTTNNRTVNTGDTNFSIRASNSATEHALVPVPNGPLNVGIFTTQTLVKSLYQQILVWRFTESTMVQVQTSIRCPVWRY